ncbi:hypothetical protein EIP86_001931 [Pleurotus ostreatoroseus]|nr:hypothetical protein EIP86_001931 [Pleurotus ostreatoroseus]
MPLASSGLRALPAAPRALGTTARSIHIPAFIPRPVVKPSTSLAQTFFKQTRTLLSRLVTTVTAPGIYATPAQIPQALRQLHVGPGSARTIHQRLTFPTRYALSKPIGGPFLAKPPAIPRSVAQVGLGTARNFSSTRPIFQNLVDNVPVAGRAFCEADFDVKAQKGKGVMRPKKYSKEKENKSRRKNVMQPVNIVSKPAAEETKDELDHYFPAPVVPSVTTYLLIPLAPTPSSRLPLPLSPPMHSTTHPLLPLPELSSIHTHHGTHSLRVSTLFARLDTARVFDEPGVSCSAFGGPHGACTVLEVKFAGWTEARVRSVLGEAGTGWCVLEEVQENENDNESQAMDDALSEMSFDTHSVTTTPPEQEEMDPSASFILPTLDFSASFATETGSWARAPSVSELRSSPASDLEFHNAWTSLERDLDSMSDSMSDASFSDGGSDGWGDALTSSRRSSTGSDGWVGLGFSSRFSGRLQNEVEIEEPREAMF